MTTYRKNKVPSVRMTKASDFFIGYYRKLGTRLYILVSVTRTAAEDKLLRDTIESYLGASDTWMTISSTEISDLEPIWEMD